MKKEDESIEQIKKIISKTPAPQSLLCGIGDDCAVIRPETGTNMVLSVDSFVEGSHFSSTQLSFEEIGTLACLGAISDLAAMAAVPLYVLVSAKIPPDSGQDVLDGIMTGINNVCAQTGACIAGGNLAADSKISLDITVCGSTPENSTVLRSTAKTGDGIFVSGLLGTGALRLKWLQAGRPQTVKKEQVFPCPRTKQALFLAEKAKINAMMDISDGLVKDLSRLCKASQCGAVLCAQNIPANTQTASRLGQDKAQMLDSALYGGEEYELCFTAPEDGIKAILEEFRQLFNHSLYCVGHIQADSGIFLEQNGMSEELDPEKGFDHFK